MSRYNAVARAAASLLLAACGAGCAHKSVPVAIKRCDVIVQANAVDVELSARSSAAKPISVLQFDVDLGGGTVSSGAVTFTPPLATGQLRDGGVHLPAVSHSVASPIHCTPTGITYADGSSG
jgi:P pilus assembly chaperone PapD